MRDRVSKGKAVILTAIEVEFMAVRKHLVNIHEAVYNGTVYERGYFTMKKWAWDVLIGQVGMGNASAASAVERAITYFGPEVILFVGVAGGIKEKDVKIGDVVAATKAYGYESGKEHDTGFLVRPEVAKSSFRLVERAKAEARKKIWLERIPGYPDLLRPEPQALVGAIAAGEKIIASTNSDLFKFLYRHYNDALAVEMEGRGFLEAAYANEPAQALIIRGISDLIDNKSTYDALGSQELAASHAAAFAFEVLAQLNADAIPQEQSISTRVASVPLEIYYSFASVREDEALVGQFARQLAILRNQGYISEWHRSKVLPGQVVNTEVARHLNAADILLLFISPDYMVSPECTYEMKRAIERHESGAAIVIPVLLRPVALLKEAPFAHIQGFPRNGRSITEFGQRKGSIFAEIADEISKVVKKVEAE